MTDNPNLSFEALAKLRDDLTAGANELKGIPDDLNHAFDLLRAANLAAYMMLTGKRDEMQEKLKQIIDKVQEAIDGMFAPWLFVDYAAYWNDVGTKVSKVKNRLGSPEFNMDGNWDGFAYKAYTASKTSQLTAMNQINLMCQKIHDELLVIAEDGRNLYSGIVNNLTTMLAELVVAIAESVETAGIALIWTVNNMNSAIVAGAELIVGAMVDFIETDTKAVIAADNLAKMVDDPEGFAVDAQGNNIWPTSETQGFDNRDDDWKSSTVA